MKTYFFGHPPGPIGRWISPPKQNSSKWVDPVAVPTADQALAVSGTGRSYRRCECSETLIRHARPNLGVALPVIALTMTVELSPPFALLVSMVCSTALASSRLLTAWLAAIPLSAVATGADCEDRTAFRGATGSHAENGLSLVDRASHSGIMAQKQSRMMRKIRAFGADDVAVSPAIVQKKTISDDRLQVELCVTKHI